MEKKTGQLAVSLEVERSDMAVPKKFQISQYRDAASTKLEHVRPEGSLSSRSEGKSS